MSGRRQWILAAVLVALGLLAVTILFDVLGTIFFAITVTYVLAPLHRRLVAHGFHPWWASVGATALAFLAAVSLFVPLSIILYLRRADLVTVIGNLPESMTLALGTYVYTIDASAAFQYLTRTLTGVAVDIAQSLPVLLVKLTLFAFLVFALLIHRHSVSHALLAPIPSAYHDIAAAFHHRVRQTLFAIYVLQAATAIGTFLVALPIFYLFGYSFPVTLAVLAGFLQFLPIVGPSVIVGTLVAYHIAVGEPSMALAIGGVGFFLIAWLPDAVIRPRLARETADLPATLYFIGFTGGLLSLGPVGVIAGPLAVALLAEATSLLTDELNGRPQLEPPRSDQSDDHPDQPVRESP